MLISKAIDNMLGNLNKPNLIFCPKYVFKKKLWERVNFHLHGTSQMFYNLDVLKVCFAFKQFSDLLFEIT